jgi:thiamine biosynthesis lipoprotein
MPQCRRVVEALELYVAFVGIPDVTIGSNFSRDATAMDERRICEVMGTVFSFELRPAVPDGLFRRVEEDLVWVDRHFSTYKANSDISLLAGGRLAIADCCREVREVLEICMRAEHMTHGYFTPAYNGTMDPTGLVKGWAIRRASELLTRAGCPSHVINGGGDVLARGNRLDGAPWRVGVSDPRDSSTLLAIVSGVDVAVATSGNKERPGHIINPRTGQPAVSLNAVTVIGPDIVVADAIATAAVAMEADAMAWLEQLADYEAIVVTADGEVACTRSTSEHTRPRIELCTSLQSVKR